MTTNILMPALSPTMEEGKLSLWKKKEGDLIKSGDIIAEIETDKATMDVEAADDGILAKILVPEGTEHVAVNTPIAFLAEEGEDISAAIANAAASSVPVSQKVPPSVSEIAVPLEVKKESFPDDEIPAGTQMVSLSVREALRDAMAEEMRQDPDVFLIGEEVAEYQGAYKVSQEMLQEFGPQRVIDTPITEYGFAGIATGAAFSGLKPIVEFMTFNFGMQAIDHIINSAAKTLYMSGGQISCPIVFRGPNGAAARVAAQHSQDYAAWYSHIPGLTVVMPYSAADAKGLLKSAIRSPNPVVFLENELLYGKKFDVPVLDDFLVPLGKARIARPGEHVTIISWGIGMTYALPAAEKLSEEGLDAEVLDLRTLRPLDMDAIVASVKKTNRCVIVEEGWPQCGMSAGIAARIMEEAFDYLDAPVMRVTGKDVPMPYAANLEKLALPSVDEVVEAAKRVCYR